MRSLLILSAASLLGTTAAFAPDDAAPAKAEKPAGEKMICRRETPIGSLIASRKTCMTAKQWQARAERGNDEARKMVYDNQGRPTGN